MNASARIAIQVAGWLAKHPGVERVYFPGDPAHPDAAAISRLFPKDRYSGLVAFEIKNAGRAEIFQFMERLKMIVRATSLGDVHTMILYPAMARIGTCRRSIASGWGFRDNSGAHVDRPSKQSTISLRTSIRRFETHGAGRRPARLQTEARLRADIEGR